jgi:uncharacterized protein (DUF302 family)
MKRTLALVFFLVLSLQSLAGPSDNGLVTVESKHTVAQTIEKFEAAVKDKGLKVFTRIDHALAAQEFGRQMPAATVVIFGNPKNGTPMFIKSPTLAIDLPLKAMVWEDKKGTVYLSINSATYLFKTIYHRHGLPAPENAVARLSSLYDYLTEPATQ